MGPGWTLSALNGDGDVVVASAGEQWPLSGIELKAVTPVVDGVVRIESHGSGVYLVHTSTGGTVTISPEADPDAGRPYYRSHVHFWGSVVWRSVLVLVNQPGGRLG